MDLSIIVLAAGQGTRMRSDLPKVLHRLGGRPLLSHALDTAHRLDAASIHVVIGHGADQVRRAFEQSGVHWVIQERRLGTGHAVAQVLPDVPDTRIVLVMYGDVPLITPATTRLNRPILPGWRGAFTFGVLLSLMMAGSFR